MPEKLRMVLFNLNEQNLALGDFEDGDPKGILADREGFFHRWGDVIWYDPSSKMHFQKTIAIVEELKSGNVFEVSPHCLKFKQT